MMLAHDKITGEMYVWACKHLDAKSWRPVTDKTHWALVGYEFDNEDDVILMKLSCNTK